MGNDKRYDTGRPTQYVRIVNHQRAPLGLPPAKFGDKILQPGENNVSAEHWAAIRDVPHVQHWLEAGMVSEGDPKKTAKPEGPSEREQISDLSEKDALAFIGKVKDREILTQCMQTEKRPEVRDALARRFEALGTGK